MADKPVHDANDESLAEQASEATETLRERIENAMEEAAESVEKAGRQAKKAALDDDAEYIDTYTVQKGDTLSGIALRYYDSPARDKWMAIYEANKDVIGDNPGMIYPGQEFKIPRLED